MGPKFGPDFLRRSVDERPKDERVHHRDEEPEESVDLSKRKFVGMLGGLGVAAVLGGRLLRDQEEGISGDVHDVHIDTHEASVRDEVGSVDLSTRAHEVRERFPQSAFEREISGYKALALLRKDEVLFVDEHNVPLGPPVRMEPFIGRKVNKFKEVENEQYLFTPGTLNEAGILEEGIAGEWLRQAKRRFEAAHPGKKVARVYHANHDFVRAYNEYHEPELTAAIANGTVETPLDIVRHFADKPVVGAERFTRREYVSQAIEFTPWDNDTKLGVPRIAQDELCRVVPGLCAQESKFNADLVSKVGAEGIMQFMPETWASYGGQPEEAKSLMKQVEIAGEFMSDLYYQLRQRIGNKVLREVWKQFPDSRTFQLDFMVPLTINAYNAGAGRMAEAVRLYMEAHAGDELPHGKDLFIAIADFAAESDAGKHLKGYKTHAREYVPRVYAQAEALAEVG